MMLVSTGCLNKNDNPFSDPSYVPTNRNMLKVEKISESTTNNTVTLNNVIWDYNLNNEKFNHEFHDTTIKYDNVKEAYFFAEKTLKNDKWTAGHGLLTLIMKDGHSITTANGKKAKGLCISIEAWRDDGVPYKMTTGLTKAYKLIYMLYTFESEIDMTTRLMGRQIDMVKLKLNQTQLNNMLRVGIEDTLIDRTGEFYNTLTNSCITNAADVINKVLDKDKKIRLWTIPSIIPNLKVSVPDFFVKYLVKKDLGVRYETVTAANYKSMLAPNEFAPNLYDDGSQTDDEKEADALAEQDYSMAEEALNQSN
jgi:hypothetical protein